MTARKKSTRNSKPTDQGGVQIYTLEVFLTGGPITEKFAEKNPVVSRTIEIRGNQTLEELHNVIFEAFGRWEEHMYEFQFGKRPMDPKGPNYVLSCTLEMDLCTDEPPAGCVEETTIGSLNLKVGRHFGYWFDFGDDWWHEIEVTTIEEKNPTGKYPKVTKKVGKNPPQYANE